MFVLAQDICNIINLSLELGLVPAGLKRAIILPLLKKAYFPVTLSGKNIGTGSLPITSTKL